MEHASQARHQTPQLEPRAIALLLGPRAHWLGASSLDSTTCARARTLRTLCMWACRRGARTYTYTLYSTVPFAGHCIREEIRELYLSNICSNIQP